MQSATMVFVLFNSMKLTFDMELSYNQCYYCRIHSIKFKALLFLTLSSSRLGTYVDNGSWANIKSS